MSEPIERVAVQVDRLCWTGILLGLAFTMTNVQQFAAAGAAVWSLAWFAAWLLDPMVSLVLLAILRAEQVTARHGVRLGGWVRAAKWFTLGATYVMNTWSAFVAGSAALVVLHSVPPLVVFVAAEAVTELRDKLGTAAEAVAPAPRTSFAEYLAVARKARKSGAKVSPAWVREVTGCSRGLSSKLAAALNGDQ
ncbi:hypothetical protein SK803_08685 [Lentzea sp. BCCO 10_0856]|uniref:Uncharacterized protein n=1 Tax=Lentzea miocenica TaxID=3095431 RepID=A0ABU4SWK2_9PSEU|nr:hypothetical protein [Lentzea sp. BCCO 10_0856]MDX8030286.1 hypothetical protein [Lentzea sp. BCCO 10_0856]